MEFKIAKKRFKDYPKYRKQIAIRKANMLVKDADVNNWIRAKGTITKSIENTLIKYENDIYIQNRLFWINCVEATLDELDDLQRKYVTEYFFDDVYDYRGLAAKYGTSKNVINRACNKACQILSEKLGEIDN